MERQGDWTLTRSRSASSNSVSAYSVNTIVLGYLEENNLINPKALED